MIAEDANRAYMNGYNARSAEEMQDAANMLLRMQGEMAVVFGLESGADVAGLVGDDPLAFVEELRRSGNLTAGSTVLDYVNARMVYEGMMQRVRDDIDSRVAASDAAVDGRVNRTTGMVEGAVLKAQDMEGRERRVYVTNGRVAMLADGSGVDTERSDGSIVVRDAETGEVEMVEPEAIFRQEEPVDPETEKRTAAEAIRQGMAAEAAAKIDGKVAFNVGDTYTLTYPDGRQMEMTVVEVDGTTDAGEGRVWVSPDGGSPALAMSREEIQAGVDATNRGRVERFVEERRSSEGPDVASREKDYALNEELTLRDGNGGTFGAVVVDADYNDGTVLVQVETPDGPRVMPYSREELDAMRADVETMRKDEGQPGGSGSNSLSLQGEANNGNNGSVSERVSQAERGAEASQDERMEEAAAGLRERIAAAAGDAQASGRALPGGKQEVESRAAESYAKEKGYGFRWKRRMPGILCQAATRIMFT